MIEKQYSRRQILQVGGSLLLGIAGYKIAKGVASASSSEPPNFSVESNTTFTTSQPDITPTPESLAHLTDLTIVQFTGERPTPVCGENCKLNKIILHWTGGTYNFEPETLRAYHFNVGPDGTVYEGNHWPENNAPGPDGQLGDAAFHTWGENSRSIGIAIRGMKDMPNTRDCHDSGPYPLTKEAFEAMCMLAALEARKYSIPIDNDHIRTHSEETRKHQYEYDHKNEHWDLNCLSFAPDLSEAEVKNKILETVQYYYNQRDLVFGSSRVHLVKQP